MDRSSQRKDALIGRTIADKFRIEEFVGQGAMGAVYRATQLTLKKRVAIKVMNRDRPADGAYAARFKREAKAASRMDHPNSLRVIDVGEDQGLLYIAMEFLEGKDLFKVLKEEFPLPKERIVNILSQTLAAIAAAHEMGVIHRDLKPENIMLLPAKDDEGNPFELVKVCDFGIAKILDHGEEDTGTRSLTQTGTLTAHGMLIGTPEYMSPEQARGEPADPRSDLYSLGVILYQMLTGRLPFAAKDKIRMVIKHVEEIPPPPSSFDSQIDLRLDAICVRCLAKRPEDRFQSAREMRSAVRDVLDPRDAGALTSLPAIRRSVPSASVPPPAGSQSDLHAGRISSDGKRAAAPVVADLPPPQHTESGELPLSPGRRALLEEPVHTTETVDPHAAEALAEVRKRLSERPPPSSSPTPTPPPMPAPLPPVPAALTVTTRVERRSPVTSILLAIIAVALIALVVLLARR